MGNQVILQKPFKKFTNNFVCKNNYQIGFGLEKNRSAEFIYFRSILFEVNLGYLEYLDLKFKLIIRKSHISFV